MVKKLALNEYGNPYSSVISINPIQANWGLNRPQALSNSSQNATRWSILMKFQEFVTNFVLFEMILAATFYGKYCFCYL